MKVSEWVHKGFSKGNNRISMMLDGEVIESHKGYKECPIGRENITKWCIAEDQGREYIVAKSKSNNYFVKIWKT